MRCELLADKNGHADIGTSVYKDDIFMKMIDGALMPVACVLEIMRRLALCGRVILTKDIISEGYPFDRLHVMICSFLLISWVPF